MSGCSRPVANASAIPSIPGILTSVSSRSNSPLDCLSASRAVAPSAVSVRSCPSPPSARTTNSRRASSSSAIRIFAIVLLRSGGRILRIEETHYDIACCWRRRDKAAAEFQFLAGAENAAARHGGPGIDFLTHGVPCGEAQAWYFSRLVGNTDDGAFDDERGKTFLCLFRDPHIVKLQVAQIDRQTNRRE